MSPSSPTEIIEAGRVYTFYSYKGGVGRSMAVASVATLLARWGHRVLVIDWDLEAPGIERFFLDSAHGQRLDQFQASPGLVDVLESCGANRSEPTWRDCVVEIAVEPVATPVHMITAGRKDDQYVRRLQEINWDALFRQHDFASYLEQMRTEWIEQYRYVLVDSRTGISDIGGLCTIYLPDVLVALFAANVQSLEGVIDVVSRAKRARTELPFDRGNLVVVPVPARDESRTEYEQSREWRQVVATRLADVYADLLPRGTTASDALDVLRIPYVPYWSFGERIPVLKESIQDTDSISYSYAVLARLLSSDLQWDIATGTEVVSGYDGTAGRRGDTSQSVDFFVSYVSEDRRWAEWIAWQLEEAGYGVFVSRWDFVPGTNFTTVIENAIGRAGRVVIVLTSAYLVSEHAKLEWQMALRMDPSNMLRRVLPVLVEPCKPTGLFATLVYIDLVGLAEAEASRRLIEEIRTAVEGRAKPTDVPAFPQTGQSPAIGPTFPGDE